MNLKEDINFNSSYKFMSKVEKYYHTISDEKEDCPLIIYNLEKSSNTPLLLIENIPHFSNLSKNYYLYPFFNNNKFNGIFIDIKFDYESYSKINNSNDEHSMKISVKIGSKEILYQEFLIKDITFYVKDEIKDYCKQNLQCFIYIEITKLKNFRIDNDINNSYFIYTNVYNAKVSPEYIYKNIVIDYKILQMTKNIFILK